MEDDPFDPRTWEPEPIEKVIWLDERNNLFTTVSSEDYQWLIEMAPWKAVPNSTRKTWYAAKSVRKGRQVTTLYMHIAILKRSGRKRPSAKHTMGDHRSSNSLNNVRENLRWATPKLNSRNRNGSHADYEGDC